LHINTQQHDQKPKGPQPHSCVLDARNHYPQIKHHTPPPKQGNNTTSHPTQGPGKHGPVVSKPNSVSSSSLHQRFPAPAQRLLLHQTPVTTTRQVPHGSHPPQ
jgi:hypothetical protein